MFSFDVQIYNLCIPNIDKVRYWSNIFFPVYKNDYNSATYNTTFKWRVTDLLRLDRVETSND